MGFFETLKDWQRLAAFHLICAISLALAETMLTSNIIGLYFGRLPMDITESALLMTPIWFLRGRWRLYGPIFVAVAAFFFWCNIMYARYTQDFISPMLILSADSYNSVVFSCVPSLIRVHDIVYLISAAVPFVAYRYLRVRKCRVSIHVGLTALVVSAISALALWPFGGLERSSLRVAWLEGNFCRYCLHLRELYKASCPIELTDGQKKQIDLLVQRTNEAPVSRHFLENRDKNLIFIVVESFNAWAVGKDYGTGRSITPTIDSLLRCDGTVSCLDVVPQITCGESSDGQFIYNTGLLPLIGTPVATLYSQNEYPALAKRLGYGYSAEFITEPGFMWKHFNTTRQYGYTELYDYLSFEAGSRDEADRKVLAAALSVIKEKPQPLFAFITTGSMHMPCEDKVPREPWIDQIDGISSLERNYLQMTHYFDGCLKTFLKDLEAQGLLEKSVVVIASDHHKKVRDVDPDDEPLPIVFIATNTGLTKRIDGPVAQIDVFPTVLDIMGVESGWRGLGTSMLDSANCSAVDSHGRLHGSSGSRLDSLKTEAWNISDLIIRGSYFGTIY